LVQPGGASEIGWIGNLAWSPDGSMLAASVNQPNRPSLFVLDADSGVVHARWRGGTGARWVSLAWSADNRHVGFWVMPVTGANVGTVGVLDVATGRAVTLPGRDFDWSPADERGQWLAVAQVPDSVFLVTPDLAAMRWLDTPNCFGVAWRPGNR
jgi:Tol biopolymer transport system component